MKVVSVLIFVFSIFLTKKSYSQELISNGSFEVITSCPNSDGQLNNATPWLSAKGTCDLYNSCNAGLFGNPSNQIGNQNARTGNGYAGFFASQGVFEVREYLHAQLISPLVAGTEYCIKFYVVLGDTVNDFGENIFDVAVNDIGMYIGNSPFVPDPTNFNHIAVTPQIINNSALQTLNNRNDWMEISGTYTAVGGEQYITIGSFADQASQDTTWLDMWNSNNWAYYLVDDISFRDCSSIEMTVDIFGDSVICSGESITLNTSIIDGTAPYTYSWSTGATDSSILVSPISNSTYSVLVTDFNGDTATTNFSVIVNPIPTVFAGNDIEICPEDSLIPLTVQGQGSFLWNTGSFNNTIIVSPTLTTDYWVTATLSGCVNHDTVRVIVKPVCFEEFIISIPNVLTPNNDGENDIFNLIEFNGLRYTGTIINRWGNLVWNFDSQIGWNGKSFNGIECEEGVYFYTIRAFTESNEEKLFYGYVELFR